VYTAFPVNYTRSTPNIAPPSVIKEYTKFQSNTTFNDACV